MLCFPYLPMVIVTMPANGRSVQGGVWSSELCLLRGLHWISSRCSSQPQTFFDLAHARSSGTHPDICSSSWVLDVQGRFFWLRLYHRAFWRGPVLPPPSSLRPEETATFFAGKVLWGLITWGFLESTVRGEGVSLLAVTGALRSSQPCEQTAAVCRENADCVYFLPEPAGSGGPEAA